VIYNTPSSCSSTPCNYAVDFASPAVKAEVVHLASAVSNPQGEVHLSGVYKRKSNDAKFDPLHAEIVLLLRSQGKVLRTQLFSQLTNLTGGCSPNTKRADEDSYDDESDESDESDYSNLDQGDEYSDSDVEEESGGNGYGGSHAYGGHGYGGNRYGNDYDGEYEHKVGGSSGYVENYKHRKFVNSKSYGSSYKSHGSYGTQSNQCANLRVAVHLVTQKQHHPYVKFSSYNDEHGGHDYHGYYREYDGDNQYNNNDGNYESGDYGYGNGNNAYHGYGNGYNANNGYGNGNNANNGYGNGNNANYGGIEL